MIMKKKDQRGFSLVELIVTILIMSVVMLAAAGFLITSTNSYRVSNIEIKLQMEAQTALAQLTDILMEAQSYQVKLKAGEETAEGLTVVTAEHSYHFRLDEEKNQLLYGVDQREESLLAEYCSSMMISPQQRPASGEAQLIDISLELGFSGQTYQTTSCISLRNDL